MCSSFLVFHFGSGGSDVRSFHDYAGSLLVCVARGGGRSRGAGGEGGGPAVGVVTDEGGGVTRAGYFEVGFASVDEGGHTRQRA